MSLAQLLHIDIRAVLRGNDDSLDPSRAAVDVFDGHLRFAVRTQIGQLSAFADLGQTADQAVRQRDGQGHQLRCFVTGVAEHHTLIAGSEKILLVRSAGLVLHGVIHTQRDVRRLLVDRGQHGAGVGVEAVGGIIIADIADDVAGDARNIHIAGGGDFSHNHDHAGGSGNLAGYAAHRILPHNFIQNGIGNLVADLVRMPFGNGFRSKKAFIHV